MGTKILLPFHKTTDIQLASSLTKHIIEAYNDRKDGCAKDCLALENLRSNAVNATDPHTRNVTKIQAYIAQLVWLTDRLDADLGVDFAWFPTLGYQANRVESKNDILFELTNVIYNLAAIYSNLAMHSQGADDAHKTASHYFQLAAGTLHHLQNDIIPKFNAPTTSDLDTWGLSCLETLMLAQAQDFVWQKAVKDKYKDLLIAKIAAKIGDLYATAADFGTKSEGIKSEWIHHMKARHFHFMAVAQYRAALDCLNKTKYGEEVARLTDCVNCVNQGLKESRYVNQDVIQAMNALKSKAEEDLKQAKNDNDVIYLQNVPSKYELPSLDRVSLVSAKVPPELSDPVGKLGPHSELGPKLFAQLPPKAVKTAVDSYNTQKEEKVNVKIIGKLDELTLKMNELLQALGLPASIEAMDEPLNLPESLLSHAEELRQKNAPAIIQNLLQATEFSRQTSRQIYDEAANILRSEAAEDEASSRKYGTDRWPRQSSKATNPKLFKELEKVQGWLDHSEKSDSLVKNKIKDNDRLLSILSGPEQSLKHFVPHSDRYSAPAAVVIASNKLRYGLKDCVRLEAERTHRIEALRIKSREDSIESELTKAAEQMEKDDPMRKITDKDFNALYIKGLQIYEDELKFIIEQDKKQELLIKRIQDANTEFTEARKGDTTTKKREEALQSLSGAYYTYKEISSNLAAARRFYNDLIKTVNTFHADCEAFAHRRRTESSQIISNFAPDIASLNISTAASLQQQKKEEARKSTRITRASKAASAALPAEPPLTAPQPTRVSGTGNMWNPDGGIRFGAMDGEKEDNTKMPKPKTGWDPNQPIRFG